MANSTSSNSDTRSPLSPAERSRLYRRRFRDRRQLREIRISDENLNGLVKRGYLDLNELDNTQAISQALGLFLWDALLGTPRQMQE